MAAPTGQTSAPSPNHQHRTLYDILDIKKDATEDEIKRAYRKLALKYHPDKNLDNDPEKTEKFKEINHANAILSDPNKRRIYDEYGDMGIKMMDQFGDDFATLALRPWIKWLILFIAIITCGCFGCCCGCVCCCNFCCGKCAPKMREDADTNPFADENLDNPEVIVIEQPAPTAEPSTVNETRQSPPPPYTEPRQTVIVMGPPDYGSTTTTS
ncbi:J domain-containing protein [Aphelenchoides besseyi]|nr:J domain-containing protein [Aphelenchoides besseyi]KAI6211945.1 J domain-containing protein [Aphelenchoides besseyi]